MDKFVVMMSDVGCFIVCVLGGCILATSMILSQAVMNLHMQFVMPDDEDFASNDYLKVAEEQADKFLKERESQVWQQLGFEEKSFEKKYDISILSKKKDVDDRVVYKGNGTYQVQTSVEVELSSSVHAEIQPQHIIREYIITLRAQPERRWYGKIEMNWEFVDMQQLRMTPDEGTVEGIVSQF